MNAVRLAVTVLVTVAVGFTATLIYLCRDELRHSTSGVQHL